MKRSLPAWTLAALAGLGLVAGCTGGGGTSTTPAPKASRSAGPAAPGSSPVAGAPASPTVAPAATPLSPRQSPPAVLAAALAALKDGPAVHVGISATTSQGAITFSDDANARGGRQLITTSYGGSVTILFIAGVGYVQGNAVGLVGLDEVPQSQAQSEAGRWISISPGEELGQDSYDDVVDGITLSSVASELSITGPLTLTGPTTVAGQSAIAVQGRAPASMQLPATARVTLYVSASDARPLRYEVSGVSGYQNQITFSDWGEKLTLATPSGAVPASGGTPIVT
ncbi:MAG TPA: hypothetical protein VMU95_29940 [Trebonia sp.]|nr:hypothetical protein [Trebonia sp.]